MSLRVRMLLAVAAVHGGVAVLLVFLLLADIGRWRRQAEEDQTRRLDESRQRVQQAFGGNLELTLPLRLEPKDVFQALNSHPVRGLVEYGVLLNKLYEAASGLQPSDVYFNLVSAKHRPRDFSEGRARNKIREAMNERRLIPDGVWAAAPIFLKRPGAPPGEASRRSDPWGGIYFLVPVEPAEVPPLHWLRLSAVMCLGTLTLIGLTYLMLDAWILRPIAGLSEGAARVRRRDYSTPVESTGRSDEVERFIAAFNSMMREVESFERELTRRVEEATSKAEESRRGLIIAQRLAATGTLASGIAHEINNPLGGMLNAALKLHKEIEGWPPSEQRRKYLDLVIGGLQRVQEIVRRVLLFSPRRMEPRAVGILELVRQSIALVEHKARQGNVRIEVSGDNAEVLVEPGEIQQVFLNLLINATDAMAKRGGTIKVRARREESFVEVDVRDTGPGMSAEQMERCFDLFYTTKETGLGTGLGLSVALHIVSQHGGRLWVESQTGNGCTFTVRLPAATAGQGPFSE